MSSIRISSLVLLLAITRVGIGQDTPADQSPPSSATSQPAEQPPEPVQPVAQPPEKAVPVARVDETRAPLESIVEPPVRQEHVIYMPYENLPDVLDDEDSSIVLPYSQFLEMWNRLVQPDQPQIQPPVNGVITRADYVGSIRGDLAHLVATLDVQVLSAEWAQLPVQFGTAAIGSARSDDGDVLLRGVGQGQYELLVRGQGKHRITLDLVAGVKSDTEGRSFSVQCPTVGVSNLELEIPEQDLAVQVAPQRTSSLQADPNGTTRISAVLGSTDQFTVSWQPMSGSTDQAAGLANVIDTISVDVGDGVVHTHAAFAYQILRGAIGELIIELPDDQRLLDVQVPGLRDWETEMVDGWQRVRVRLHAPATDQVQLDLHTETPISEQAFQVGRVRAVGVARESGILAVRSAEDVGLESVDRESITRIDATDAPSTLRKPGSTFYKFFTPDHKLTVIASQLKPRIIVDSHLSILLEKTRLTTRGEFKYQVSRSGIFAVSFRLPADFQVDDVHTESMERFEVTSTADGPILTVYFSKKLLGDLALVVTASQARDKPAGELTLPLLEPLDVTREQGLVAVIAPESLDIKTDSTQLDAARAATPAELAAKGFQPQTTGDAALAAAFSFVTRPVSIVQTITERPRRMFVVVGTVANVKEDVVQVSTTFEYEIQFAGADTFRIAVPKGVSDRLQVEGDGIKERRRASEASDDGTDEWTIVLHSEALGKRTLTATYDQKISIPDEGTTVELQPIRVLDADRESGEIAIHKDRALSLDAATTGLEEIDPRELSQPIGPTQPYLTYRYFEHPAELTLSVTKHEIQDVVETVVRHAYIEAVITEDGPMTVRARYDLKSSERQRLAITLRNPRILGMNVAGQIVAPEKAPAAADADPDDKTYFINVARPGDSDESFQIRTVFETPRPGKELRTTDLLTLPLPQFDEGVKFQKVYVRLWVPKDYRLVGTPEGFTSHIGVGLWDSRRISHAADNPDSWFTEDGASFDFQVGGTTYLYSSLASPKNLAIDYWHIPTMTLVASVIALVIGGVLLRFSLETKVFTILILLFVALFAGLFAPSIINSWLLAARLGIAGVVALWLVTWLLWLRRVNGARSPTRPGVSPPTPPTTGGEASDETPPADSQAADAENAGGVSTVAAPADVVFADEADIGASPFGMVKSDDAPVVDEPKDETGKSERGSDE